MCAHLLTKVLCDCLLVEQRSGSRCHDNASLSTLLDEHMALQVEGKKFINTLYTSQKKATLFKPQHYTYLPTIIQCDIMMTLLCYRYSCTASLPRTEQTYMCNRSPHFPTAIPLVNNKLRPTMLYEMCTQLGGRVRETEGGRERERGWVGSAHLCCSVV